VQHHEDTIAKIVAAAPDRADWQAVIVTGSVARGRERVDSDVDVSIVVDEGTFASAYAAGRVSWVEHDLATYDGGYVDIKVLTREQFALIRERGDEPTRATYVGSRVVWARESDLRDELETGLAAVGELSDAEWRAREESGIAMLRLQAWYFAPHAIAVGDPFLLHHAAVHAVSGAARALLARHRTLFVSNKYVSSTLPTLPGGPADWTTLSTALLDAPSAESFEAFQAMVEGAADWTLAPDDSGGRYVTDNELAWLTGVPPSEYR
jgi:predicted nucleotidyltransferase